MNSSEEFLNASEAAKRLGVSAKALRLYELRGLVDPVRTAAGWRIYGPTQMARAGEVAALRALGLSLAQVARVLEGDPQFLEPALAAHQAELEGRIRQLSDTVGKVSEIRDDLAQGHLPGAGELAHMVLPTCDISIAFDLPWPWGGERFELRDIRPLNYIIGPLGCGKTRLARKIAETLPNAAFLGLERLDGDGTETIKKLNADPALQARVDKTLGWLAEEGASESPALVMLVAALEADCAEALIIDLVEAGLDQAAQEAVAAYLHHRGPDARPLFLLTRSSLILDLEATGPNEAIILCPANHSPPTRVAPDPGTPGYEAVATCLASPEVRARTEGVIAWRPEVA